MEIWDSPSVFLKWEETKRDWGGNQVPGTLPVASHLILRTEWKNSTWVTLAQTHGVIFPRWQRITSKAPGPLDPKHCASTLSHVY